MTPRNGLAHAFQWLQLLGAFPCNMYVHVCTYKQSKKTKPSSSQVFGLVKLIRNKSGSLNVMWALKHLASPTVIGFESFHFGFEPIVPHFHLQQQVWT